MHRRVALAAVFAVMSFSARAQGSLDLLGDERTSREVFILSAFVAIVIFAATLALRHIKTRAKAVQRESALLAELNDVRGRLDRAQSFLAVEPQITIVWRTGEPEIEGAIDLVTDAPVPRRVLGFGSWLSPPDAQALETSVATLREHGNGFRMSVAALNGRHLEAEGRAVGGHAVVRIRNVSEDRTDVLRLNGALVAVQSELDSARALLDAIPCPAWTRDSLGKLEWLNAAYVTAVEANDAAEAVSRGTELLEAATREASLAARHHDTVFRARAAALVRGWRSVLDVVEVPQQARSIGIAFNVSELEKAKADLKEVTDAHQRTLDQLSTGVAIFDRRQRLVFHNAAYRILWHLDAAFLEPGRSEGEILDRLRDRGMLPEQANFRAWKEEHLKGYLSPETATHIWHLPNNHRLSVVVNPNPQSGVTYLFDDVSERFQLLSQLEELIRVQSETLNALKEGVTVFGPDGRLRLFNVAFAQMWHLGPENLRNNPHIERVSSLCISRTTQAEPWQALKTAVTGIYDERTSITTRIVCKDETIFDCAAAPLPDGATLLTFTDTTASVKVERALTERNQALLDTERIRRDFVKYVSYELRLPLTAVIGFVELLAGGQCGSLNPKQRDYVGYIMKSSRALLDITGSILDLAAVEMDTFELKLQEVDVVEEIRAAVDGVQDRIVDNKLHLQIVALPNIGRFRADQGRLRQVLGNLLSNAIGFSAPGQTITLAALRRGDEIVFKVSDEGRGVPDEMGARVLDRDASAPIGTRTPGTGLGFSIIKTFVELHGGRVLLDTAPGEGTTVTCIFPTQDETVVRQGTAGGGKEIS